jgi:superfamily II DNA or RNA helicase
MAKIDMRKKSTQGGVEIVVNGVYSQVKGLRDSDAIRALDKQLSYYVQGYAFTKAYKTGWWDNKKQKWDRWDGKNHLLTKNHKFLTGLVGRAESVLKNHHIPYKITDQRKDVPFKRKIKTKNIEDREYQKRVLEATLKHKGGIVQAATGSGKSVMITELIANTNVKTMVYVIGIDLLYQMKETFEKMLGTKVGIIGDGQADVQKINVCTVWTAANALGKKYVPFDDEDRSTKEKFNSANKEKIVKAIKSTEMAIFDECQMLAAKTLQLINVSGSSVLYKYGFSGTPYREDNADLLLEAVCGKIISEVTASELIKKGFLVKPKIQFVSVPSYGGAPGNKYPTVYREYIVENDTRNRKIVKIAEKLVEKGRRALILVKNIKHGKTLLSMFPKKTVIYFVKGNVKSEERNRIRKEFTEGKIDIIIASVVYDQGVDLPNLDALILAGSGKSAGRTLQRIGRVIRAHPGKKDAIVIDFIDHAKYLLDHTTSRIETYKREVAFSLKFPKEIHNAKSKKDKKQKTAPKRLQKFEEW